ncbi:MAG: hypothetical protein A3F68_08895 [Acidobacteria bacterium RIFCSPLOWO2_12_FULL_54_10]|nr:MAG: hypothetical protein A3F68_08895 [Acidobacteria bacterium RIFCSPLOWO2_12_FULL_54_10]OFW12040.1 MAG: hypothetical protein A3H27_11680 [Acidobacteria bacterium RIFCSPLOWO2_02_FULL_59_13]
MQSLDKADGSPQNQQNLVRKEFDGISERYARRVASCRSRRWKDLAWVPRLRNANILDVACGPGTYSLELSRQATTVVGLDLAETMLHFARRRGHRLAASTNLAFVQGDVLRLPFASARFDICLCAFSFAHFPNPKNVVKEMLRVLRSGGLLAILDVVAPDNRRQRDLLNRLERSRERCYTRIRDAREFVRLFAGLPLRWEHRSTARRLVSFRQWIAASHLRLGTAAYQQAKRHFYETVTKQCDASSSPRLAGCRHYAYTVARFVLCKNP